MRYCSWWNLSLAGTIVPDWVAAGKYTLYWIEFGCKRLTWEAVLRVSLFITCYNDTLFPETGKAVVKVLERLGHTVEFPAGQTCCGQMHWNTGYQAEALPLLGRFVEQFRGAEAVVVPSSSCVAMMRDHYPKMAAELKDATLNAEVEELLPRVFEFSEFLTKRLGLDGCWGLLSASGDVSRELPWAAESWAGGWAYVAAEGGAGD